MSSPEVASSLLEQLRIKYGVDESLSLYGPSVIVPNRDYKPEWTKQLAGEGFKTYVGEQDGRVAWIIPLNRRRKPSQLVDKPFINALSVDSQPTFNSPDSAQDPRSNEAQPSTPILRASQQAATSKGCIKGRVWTQQEDQTLLEALKTGASVKAISRDLAPRLNRSPSAIETRLLKLKRRKSIQLEQLQTTQKPEPQPTRKGVGSSFSQQKTELKSLIESALLLAELPKHKPALKLILEGCLAVLEKG